MSKLDLWLKAMMDVPILPPASLPSDPFVTIVCDPTPYVELYRNRWGGCEHDVGFVALVGMTGKGRLGAAWDVVMDLVGGEPSPDSGKGAR